MSEHPSELLGVGMTMHASSVSRRQLTLGMKFSSFPGARMVGGPTLHNIVAAPYSGLNSIAPIGGLQSYLLCAAFVLRYPTPPSPVES